MALLISHKSWASVSGPTSPEKSRRIVQPKTGCIFMRSGREPTEVRVTFLVRNPRILSHTTPSHPYTVEVDRSLLVAFILQFFSGAGFELCGSVPLGTRGFLHLGQRRELWVFKFRSPMRQKEFRRPSSRQSRRSRGDHEA